MPDKTLRQLKINASAAIEKLQEFHAYTVSLWLQRQSQVLAVNQKSAIVFSPHQDDETLGCGGVIALKRQLGVSVQVVFLTDGQKGGGDLYRPKDMTQIRKQEALAALAILGVAPVDIHFLEQPDGELQHLTDKQRQFTVNQLSQLLRLYQPGEVYVPHRKDPHPDHESTYELVNTALAQAQLQVDLLQYPIWILWKSPLFLKLKPQDLFGAHRVMIDSVQDQKKQAIAAYQSQSALLPIGFLKRFWQPCEFFFTGLQR